MTTMPLSPRSLPSVGSSERPDLRSWWSTHWVVVALILFWAMEVLVVQHLTTYPEASLPLGRAIKDALRRFVLNASACTAFVCLLRGWSLRIIFGIGLVGSNVLIVYANYFGSPLSWPVIANQWREGLAVSDHGFSMLSWQVALLSLLALVVKLLLLRFWSTQSTLPHANLRKWGGVAAVTYLALGVLLAGVYKPIRRINMGSPQYIYGYSISWVAEMFSFNHVALLQEANSKAQAKSDRLSSIEQPLVFDGHVAVVQVESLDFDVVDARVDNEFVMPFLNGLKTQSMLYSVKPFHNTGSSEADFSLLTTATPNGRVNPFQIHGFSYENAIPWLAHRKGYKTVALHGNTGEFFHRRRAYSQMGFSELYFTEELAPLGVNGRWDHELLDFSAKLLNEATVPTLHFTITITSHGPFNKLEPDQCELYPSPSCPQHHYLNSMRYVDRTLERYVERLPKNTTLFVYGDHQSSVPDYTDVRAQRDRIPWFIYEKETNLSDLQSSQESGLAVSGELTQLDLVCYFRNRLEQATPPDSGSGMAEIATIPSANTGVRK